MSLCWKEHKVGRGKRDILIIGVFGRSLFYKHYHYVDNSESICSTRLLLLSGMGGWSTDALCFIAHILFWGHKQAWLPANKGKRKSFCFLVSHHLLDNANQMETIQLRGTVMLKLAATHQRILDWFGFEGTLKLISFHPPATDRDTFYLTRFLQVSSSLAWNTSILERWAVQKGFQGSVQSPLCTWPTSDATLRATAPTQRPPGAAPRDRPTLFPALTVTEMSEEREVLLF